MSSLKGKRASVVDLMSLPVQPGEGVVREEARFISDRPWAVARFGQQRLKGGWWRLECSGVRDTGSDLRLSSPHDPMIVIPIDESSGMRVKLSTTHAYDIALLTSPWPGETAFEALRLRRLNLIEQAELIVLGARRMLARKYAFRRLLPVLRRLLSSQLQSFNTTALAQPTPKVTYSCHNFNAASAGPLRLHQVGRGDIQVALAPDDTLRAAAVDLVASEFARFPEAQIIYGDVCEGGNIQPRPSWDAELARWHDYVGTPVFFRNAVESSPTQSRDWLRAKLAGAPAGSIHRVPLPLADRPEAIRSILPQVPTPKLDRFPLVSIVLPTKLRLDLLQKCLEGLVHCTDYPNVEVVVVDNGCEDPRFPAVLDEAAKLLDVVRVNDHGDFNFSRLINAGVARSTGEIIVLLNDDVEPIERDWLMRMVETAQAPDSGAVGCRLDFPDGRVQHAGVVLGLRGVCGHIWKYAMPDEAARNPYIIYPSERTAVTGACLAVRRDVFDAVGGLDEAAFPVVFNDIDFCLRLRARGYRTLYRGDARLIHHESQSRGADSQTAEKRARVALETDRFVARWGRAIACDEFGSPAFDPMSESGSVHRSLRNMLGS
jgi:GT2 family glycosyltransferase